jgi:hypothetical protein
VSGDSLPGSATHASPRSRPSAHSLAASALDGLDERSKDQHITHITRTPTVMGPLIWFVNWDRIQAFWVAVLWIFAALSALTVLELGADRLLALCGHSCALATPPPRAER